MDQFLLGVMAMGYAVVALFFLRFWKDTNDRLFAIFALTFVLLGLTRVGLASTDQMSEDATPWYWLRFAAYALIVVAILDKNRPHGPAKSP